MTAQWQKLLSREGVDITSVSLIDAAFYEAIWNYTGTQEELFFTHFEKDVFTHYIGVDPDDLGRQILRQDFDTPEKIEKLYARGNLLIEKTRRLAAEWRHQFSITKPELSKLASAYLVFEQEFREINRWFSIWPWLALEVWQKAFEALLNPLIKEKKLSPAEEERVIAAVYRPWKETAIMRLQNELSTGASAEVLAEKYQFLRSWAAIWYRPIDSAWVKNIAKPGDKQVSAFSLKDAIEMLDPSVQERKELEFAPYAIFFKDWRDDIRREHAYLWSFLFEVIARHFNISSHDLGYLSAEEFQKVLRGEKLDPTLINERKSGISIITSVGNLVMKVKTGKDLESYISKISESEDGPRAGIKGFVAFAGKVQGKVQIIRSYHDIKKFAAGSVLVANTTHPNYLPAMQKASAIITNEGGIISHAAIVARELKIPCIVGTKNATRLLKDGDKIQVDADNGIVKIIEP